MGRIAKQSLSQRQIDALKPNGKPQQFGDAATRGLQFWMGATGVRKWRVRRPDGSRVIFDGALTLIEARLAATTEAPPPPPKPTQATTIRHLIDLYAQARGAAWASRTARTKHLHLFLGPILDKPPSTMTTGWLNDRSEAMLVMTHRLGRYRASSVTTYRKSCATFAAWLCDQEILTKTPFRKLRRLAVDDRIKALSEEEIDRLIRKCIKWPRIPIAACVMLAVTAGCRRNECLLLEKGDIDLKEGRIHLRAETCKSGKGRSFFMTDDLRNYLEDVLDQLPEKRPLECGHYFEWNRLRKAVGLDHCAFHHLRHSWATSALRRGGNLKAIQHQLGHHSIEITSRYLHVVDHDNRQLTDLFNRYIAT